MALKLWRCLQCKAEFEAAKPACAACGIDPAADPRDADLITELTLIHFDPPGKRPGRGAGHAACNSGLKTGHPRCQFSGEPTAVNCAKCKASEVYTAADGLSDGPSEEVKAKPVKPKAG